MSEQTPVPEFTAPPAETPPARARRPGPGIVFPLLLIYVGVILLLHTTQAFPGADWTLLWQLWPVVLVLIGVDILSRRAPVLVRVILALVVVGVLVWGSVYLVTTASPVEAARQVQQWQRGSIEEGAVAVDLGAGQLDVRVLGQGADEQGLFARVDLESAQAPIWDAEADPPQLRLSQSGWWPRGGFAGTNDWRVWLSPRVSFRSLRINTGAGEDVLDLASLRVEDLKVNMGVGRIQCTLPGGGDSDAVWRFDTGIGSIDLRVPAEAPVRIKAHTALGSVNTHGDLRQQGSYYLASGCQNAGSCITVEVNLAIGSIELRQER